MKHLIIAVSALGLLYGVGVRAAGEPPEAKTEGKTEAPPAVEMKTDEEKVNYSLGFELGKDLKRQELKLLPDALLRGAEDGLSGGKALVNTRQRAAALKQIREMRAKENLEQSQAFLARIADK